MEELILISSDVTTFFDDKLPYITLVKKNQFYGHLFFTIGMRRDAKKILCTSWFTPTITILMDLVIFRLLHKTRVKILSSRLKNQQSNQDFFLALI
jgi:hypothetical protein